MSREFIGNIGLPVTIGDNMNKARLRQDYTLSGCWITDLICGVFIGLVSFVGLVLFFSW